MYHSSSRNLLYFGRKKTSKHM